MCEPFTVSERRLCGPYIYTGSTEHSLIAIAIKTKIISFKFIQAGTMNHTREPLYIIAWWLQSTSAQKSVPSC